MRGALVFTWALGLSACGKRGEVEAGAPGSAAFTGVSRLALSAADDTGGRGERLLGYRWAGHGTVPCLSDQAPASLLFGPVGRTPSTLLYLTFDGVPEREAAEQAPHWTFPPAPASRPGPPPEGRFGGGLEVKAGEHLALRCDEDLSPAALTIEFWIRPERVTQAPLLSVPGLLELQCQSDGVLHLSVHAGAKVTTSAPAALVSGHWSHVGIVVDPELLHVARLVLDDQAQMGRLEGVDPLPSIRGVELGGGPLGFCMDELRVSGRAANTAELIEDWQARPQPLERLELSTESGVRSLEVWTRFVSEPVVDNAAEFASGELEHALADDGGLRWVEGDWQRIRALDPPLARTCHPTVYLGDGRLFVFSGEVRDSHLPPMLNTADTWLFHTREESWERVPTPLAPPGRCHQQAAYSPDHDLVLMSTGWSNGNGEPEVLFSDTWVFHVGERRWEQRHPSGPALTQGSEGALVYHPRLRSFLMFRGNTVAAYDPERDSWSSRRMKVKDEHDLPSDYEVPGALSAAYDPVSDGVVLFGGQHWQAGGEGAFCDRTLLYEPGSNQMPGSNHMILLDLPESPSARVRPGFAYDSRRARIVLFGGVRDQLSQRMDDLWSFDPARRRWTRHEASGTPSARGGYMLMSYDSELDRFFLLCGRHDTQRFLEEAWSLSLDEHAEGRARYAFDRAGFGQRTWFWEGTTPGDSALEFRFRGSEDALSWGEWSPVAPPAERYVELEVTLRPGSAGERPTVRTMGFR